MSDRNLRKDRDYIDFDWRPHIADLRDGPFKDALVAFVQQTPNATEVQFWQAFSEAITLHGDAQRAFYEATTAAALPSKAPVKALACDARAAPPRAGEMLIGLFCRRDIREAVLGDLDEKFAELAERRGAKVAEAWYWGQAGRSVLFFAVRWGRRLLELEAILKRIL